MPGERRVFDKEFKLMSVELSNSRTDLGALAKELDIPPAMLYRWLREFSAKQNGSFPCNGKVILSDKEQ
ncbi:transposase [Dyadobacter subterraneus]|uniref:Transposase n=1 Tax=Dyadobacter subterraneus TaxID=2773304 RepID=A0ABR9WCJ7_9BACT|nr:transposase [Dyadobacter subterraneus]MBE9462096.1 transposase [Dyadobacter subterraneus]